MYNHNSLPLTHAAYVQQEMWALSCFMTGAPMADVTTLFREAFFRYNSVNPLQPKTCVRFATRSMLLLADYCRQHGLHAEAHSALTRAQSQVSHLLTLRSLACPGCCLCLTLGTRWAPHHFRLLCSTLSAYPAQRQM